MGKENTSKTNILSDAEWAKVRKLAEKELNRLAKSGLIDVDEFDFYDYDKYEAEQEINKFISFRKPYID